MNLEAFRAQFGAYEEGVYVNHAAISPFSQMTHQAWGEWANLRSHVPVDPFPQILEIKNNFHLNVSRLIGADSPDSIAFIPNTSTGINMVATAIDWQPGDRIILNPLEFPANVYPFLNLGKDIAIDWVEPLDGEIRVEQIEKIMTDGTRVVSISFVQFMNGFRADLEAIGRLCHDRRILFMVDGIQGTGVVPVDVQKWQVDAWICGGHKWLMWPMGTGFLYVKPELQEKLKPKFAGWLSVKDAWNMLDYRLDFLETAEVFELGTLNFSGMAIANRVMDGFFEVGIDKIHHLVENLAGQLITGLKEHGFRVITPGDSQKRAGIVSVQLEGPEAWGEKLRTHGIFASVRGDVLRFAIHGTNNEGDIRKILQVMAT